VDGVVDLWSYPGSRARRRRPKDAPVLEALIDINAVSLARVELDPATLLLVRIAALAAVDAPAASYLMHVGPAVESGTVSPSLWERWRLMPTLGRQRSDPPAAEFVLAAWSTGISHATAGVADHRSSGHPAGLHHSW
jgi:hypothetical protein